MANEKCWCGHQEDEHDFLRERGAFSKKKACLHKEGSKKLEFGAIVYSFCYCMSFRPRQIPTQSDRDWLRGYEAVAKELVRLLGECTNGYGYPKTWAIANLSIYCGREEIHRSIEYRSSGWEGRASAALDAWGG